MKTKICICTIFFLLFLTSCSGAAVAPTATPIDISAMQTAAVESFIAGMTQTASAYTPTPELTATITPTATLSITDTPGITGTPTEVICDGLDFIGDVTVPDGTVETAGQEFVKTWKVKNTGSCTWTTGYKVIYDYGEKIGGQDTALTAEVLPTTEAEISITLKAPLTAGIYKSFYILSNNNGFPFGTVLTVVFTVQ